MAGIKGRSGRHRKGISRIQEYLDRIKDRDLPKILDALVEKAISGDKDAQIYLCNKLTGMPRQALDSTVKGAMLMITPDEYELMSRLVFFQERELLTEANEVRTSDSVGREIGHPSNNE